jgi:hypothetical protein
LQVLMLYVYSFEVRVLNHGELLVMVFMLLIMDSPKNTCKLSMVRSKSVLRVFVIVSKTILNS